MDTDKKAVNKKAVELLAKKDKEINDVEMKRESDQKELGSVTSGMSGILSRLL